MRESRATTKKPPLNVLRIRLMLNLWRIKCERKQKPHHQMMKKRCGQKRTSFLLTQSHRKEYEISRKKKWKRRNASIVPFWVWSLFGERRTENNLNIYWICSMLFDWKKIKVANISISLKSHIDDTGTDNNGT